MKNDEKDGELEEEDVDVSSQAKGTKIDEMNEEELELANEGIIVGVSWGFIIYLLWNEIGMGNWES